jgi:hypothetical protein
MRCPRLLITGNNRSLLQTWLPFGEVPIGDLVLSGYSQELPPPTASEDAAEGSAAPPGEWVPMLPQIEIVEAFDVALRVLADAPDE